MKKRNVAVLLSGLLAIGGLAMNAPATAEAMTSDDCAYESGPHIHSYEVTTVNGHPAVTIDIEFESKGASFSLYAFEKKLEKIEHEYDNTIVYYPVFDELLSEGWPKEAISSEHTESGTYTFTGLTSDKTYYIYCVVVDRHDMEVWEDSGEHYAAYLAPSAPDTDAPAAETPSDSKPAESKPVSGGGSTTPDFSKITENNVISQIADAQSGSTVVLDQGVTTLSNSVMKELLKKGDVSLQLAFTYNDTDYVILIPAGAALDDDIPWYGPLYLAQQYGNLAGTAAAAGPTQAGASYTVRSGDTLSKIAAANNMTLQQLLAKNPQIKNANKIVAGQQLNL